MDKKNKTPLILKPLVSVGNVLASWWSAIVRWINR